MAVTTVNLRQLSGSAVGPRLRRVPAAPFAARLMTDFGVSRRSGFEPETTQNRTFPSYFRLPNFGRSLMLTQRLRWAANYRPPTLPEELAVWEGPKSNSGAPTIAYFADGTLNTSNVEVAVAQTCPLSFCSVASVKAARRPMEISRPVARIVPLVLLRPFTKETFNSSVV